MNHWSPDEREFHRKTAINLVARKREDSHISDMMNVFTRQGIEMGDIELHAICKSLYTNESTPAIADAVKRLLMLVKLTYSDQIAAETARMNNAADTWLQLEEARQLTDKRRREREKKQVNLLHPETNHEHFRTDLLTFLQAIGKETIRELSPAQEVMVKQLNKEFDLRIERAGWFNPRWRSNNRVRLERTYKCVHLSTSRETALGYCRGYFTNDPSNGNKYEKAM